MPNTLSKENELQRKAFELYYGLGDKRSLRAVAETIGRTERTVAGWSRAFNWVARVTQRNIENAQNSNEAKITAELTDVRTKYRILINNLMADFSKDIAQGKVKVKNINDFERLVKLDMLLMGEATERVERGGTQELSQDAKDRLDEIAQLKHEDFMDAMLRGLFGGSVGHIEITGKRNGKTDEEIAEIVDKTIKDIISGMAGVELEEIKEGNGYTEVHITGNANPIEVREYIEKELKDRLAMVL